MRKFAAALAFSLQVAGWGQSACDRACLENFVDQYMDALIAHDPKKLPMTARVKNTEDAVRLEPGDGFWRTANAKGSYRLFVTDTETGQVAFMGTMREDPSNAVIVAIRLKVENRQVSEIENLVVRNAQAAANLEKLGAPNPVFLEALPVAQRASRAELIRVADMYFSGLEKNDGKGEYPFADGCERIQNGVQTTNNPNAATQSSPPPGRGGRGGDGKQPAAPPKPQGLQINIVAMGCMEQFKSGYFRFVNRIRDRRFVVVDRERGLALAITAFDQPAGKYATFKLADGREITAGPERPTTLEIAELFKIENDKIRRVEAVQMQIPYGMLSGWSSYEDGMSNRARTQ
ncbi:MAG: hypothetical protein JWO19_3511 [Bryobacterales bacterium]|nr:hypothetical protein [Bryobacterales bacterium]